MVTTVLSATFSLVSGSVLQHGSVPEKEIGVLAMTRTVNKILPTDSDNFSISSFNDLKVALNQAAKSVDSSFAEDLVQKLFFRVTREQKKLGEKYPSSPMPSVIYMNNQFKKAGVNDLINGYDQLDRDLIFLTAAHWDKDGFIDKYQRENWNKVMCEKIFNYLNTGIDFYKIEIKNEALNPFHVTLLNEYAPIWFSYLKDENKILLLSEKNVLLHYLKFGQTYEFDFSEAKQVIEVSYNNETYLFRTKDAKYILEMNRVSPRVVKQGKNK